MRMRLTIASRVFTTLWVLCLLTPAVAVAAPVTVSLDFTSPTFVGPAPGTVNQFLIGNAGGSGVDVTLQANPGSMLYWDNLDEFGFGDGFAVAGGYANDEFEAPEVLTVKFSEKVKVKTFSMTDVFYEDESNLNGSPLCNVPNPNCYQEEFWIRFNFSSPWFVFYAALDQYRVITNGVLDVPINAGFVTAMEFWGPGLVDLPSFAYTQRHEASLGKLTFETYDTPQVPEPTSMIMLGTGLLALVARKRILS